MKKLYSFLILSTLLFWGLIGAGFVGADSSGLWSKYVAADGSYSFLYPQGWKVTAHESMVVIDNSQTGEQLLMAGVPFEPRLSPQELAMGFIQLLKSGNPTISAANWRTDPGAGNSRVSFELSDSDNSKQYHGLGMVIKTDRQAIWFSYTAPAAVYTKTQGLSILQGFMGSLASGAGSKTPQNEDNTAFTTKIDRNAQAFLFVLEFALGAPLTKTQEDQILQVLKNGWRELPEADLVTYDRYPVLAQNILKMGPKDLADLRTTLEQTIREWLETANPTDKAVKSIRTQLQTRGRVLIAGEPPLTEMALNAYSEMIAFARLLRQNPQATPEQIPAQNVAAIKNQALKVWPTFSGDERRDIATAPGLWVCLRILLWNGAPAEQEKIRNQLQQLDNVSSNISPADNDNKGASVNSGTKKPADLTTHWCLMQMQQQTFNTHMWSRGFNYLPSTGRMW